MHCNVEIKKYFATQLKFLITLWTHLIYHWFIFKHQKFDVNLYNSPYTNASNDGPRHTLIIQFRNPFHNTKKSELYEGQNAQDEDNGVEQETS